METSEELKSVCSIARTLEVLGERWTFLVLREAFIGSTRFAQFRQSLGVAPDVLSDRLATLVNYGVMTRHPYQDPGSRPRLEYRLTPAGLDLRTVLGALQQWGDTHLPRPEGPTLERRSAKTNRPLHVAFIDTQGQEVPPNQVIFTQTPAHPNYKTPHTNKGSE